ncbi:MAG: NfeD family protein [Thermoguttaceae bacterium]|jgi:membrane-bound ClpP family serine protease
MEPWIWPLILLAVGLGLAVLEVFFPSAGTLAFLAVASLLAAIVLAFWQGPGMGLTILAAVVVAGPITIILAFRWWPYTSMGRQVLLEAPKAEDVLPDDPRRRHLKGLVGRVGRAKCDMLPGGVVAVDGQTVDAVSEGLAIRSGQAVRVIKVQANRVVIRPVEEETPSAAAESPLERPIDSIAADPFEPPRLDNPPGQPGE